MVSDQNFSSAVRQEPPCTFAGVSIRLISMICGHWVSG